VDSIHLANPDSKVMAYQYLQSLPQIAAGQSNKLWILPVELTKALEGIGGALGGITQMSDNDRARHVDRSALEEAEAQEVLEARRAAEDAAAAASAAAAEAAAQVSGNQPTQALPISPPPPAPVAAYDPQQAHRRDNA
jgi:hypothetical protein